MAEKVIPVKVALRIRPLVKREKDDACTECLRTVNNEPQVILGKDKSFTYDYVFNQNTPQVDVYETAVKTLLNSLFKGYNATVLAYGQTGSGKTHTMGSGYLSLCAARATTSIINNNAATNQQDLQFDLDEVGVIPRVLNDLFNRIEDEQRSNKDLKFTVRVSFVEVYNEEIKDLFNTKSAATTEPLNIREENNTIKVVNLTETTVTNALATIQLLEKGSSLRVVGGTAMNDQSSRSHAIFTITLEQQSNSDDLIQSKFHLVDLAGSERQSKTKAEGLRLKEGININLGLLALGNVISVLGEDNPANKQRHVPYRESKLTRLLQDSLGGNSHTLMIACASPADSNMEESLNTLRYADRARKIKNKPIVNVDPQQAECSALRQQNRELQAKVLELSGGQASSFIDNSKLINELKEEIERLRLENVKILGELQRVLHINRITYERMSQIELDKEEKEKKFQEIKSVFEKIMSHGNSETTEAIALDQTINITANNSNISIINELQSKLNEFDQLKSTINQEPENETCEMMQLMTEPADKDYALRQAQMQVQLTEYDSELMKKQVLFQKMIENNMNAIKATSMRLGASDTSGLEDLKSKIETLEKEKDDLLEVIRNSDASAKKLTEQKRDRFKQLESEVNELKRKEKEFNRMIKLKEENEKHCEKLRQEIQHIKQERVKLIKQMKSDTDSFCKYKKEKEKEVNQLKALERKRQVEISKLQDGHVKQEAVLRRKNEEISRIQKQLRETSEKQKLVAEKRQQMIEKKESSSMGEKLRTWISNELELSVGLAEARMNLNKLMEERKETAAELARLTDRLNEVNDDQTTFQPPANKRKFLTVDDLALTDEDATPFNIMNPVSPASSYRMTRSQLEQRIERIKEDIEIKNVQINEIQTMVIEGDQDDRSKHLFNNIHGLLDAKVLLKHLYNSGVQYLLDLKLKQIQYDISTNGLSQEIKEMKKRYEVLEEEFNKRKKMFNTEMNQLTNHYEQRILHSLNTILDDPKCTNERLFSVLHENQKALEKKFERENISSSLTSNNLFREPMPPPMLKKKTENLDNLAMDELRRTQKLKRDHRRTRIIRKEPDNNSADSEQTTSSNENNYLGVESCSSSIQSPIPFDEQNFNTPATPLDDKIKDPDWEKTPMRIKRRTVNISKKGMFRKSKSKQLHPVIDSAEPSETSENDCSQKTDI